MNASSSSSDPLAALIDAYLAGESVDVPCELRSEFDQAIAAHGALRGMIEETQLLAPVKVPRLPPDVADDYDIERELGHGGMGVVYLARQRSLNRRVALKVLRPGENTFGPIVRRFLDEARHLAQLRHPNIVSIHEVGDADGEPYFTMDYIDGETLSAAIARGPLSPTRAVEVLKQVAAGVQHAHKTGIVHRDLKPSNVLLDRTGQIFVTDFGLARNVSQESNLTQSGELLGTPQYMSPEQARGQTSLVGEATDIHALGLLLFEMLSGRAAFGAKSPADVLVKLLNEDPPPLRSIDRRIPRDLETICLKALQKNPAARYATVSALLEDVRRFEAGEPLFAKRAGIWTKWGRWLKRHWKVPTAVLTTALLVASLAPRLFDKSVDDLIAWGKEELRDGRPEVALQVFQRAWSRSDEAQRQLLVPQLTESIRKMDDSKPAVDAALKLLPVDPNASFGRHDYLVAKAVTMEARAETSNGYFEPLHPGAPATHVAKRELAAKRLSLFLDGTAGTADERVDAERTLQAIGNSLREVRQTATWPEDVLAKLPEGTLEELSGRAENESLPLWERAKAIMATARKYESSNQTQQAIAAYRESLETFRRVYPFVAGVVSDFAIPTNHDRSKTPDAPECELVRNVLDSIHRLDPGFDRQVRGGLRFTVDRPELLGNVGFAVTLELCDESIDSPNLGLHRFLSTKIRLSREAAREVRVLPGRYRLRIVATSFQWSGSPSNDPRLIELDTDDWPKTILINDQVTELTIHVRQLKSIDFTSPAAGSRIDLRNDLISWASVPNAVKYDIQLIAFSDLPHPTTTGFHNETTSEPNFRAASINQRDMGKIRSNWPFGGSIGLRVTAFDGNGKRIAITLEDRKFLVAVPL